MISEKDLGWIAGVFDFKGRIIRKRNEQRRTPQTLIYVESKQLEIIQALAQLTGTSPEAKKQSTLSDWIRVGCLEHCPERHVHVSRADQGWSMPRTSRWTLTGASMVVFLYSVLPYLRIDRGYQEAVDAIIADQDLEGRGADAIWRAVRRMVNLGWPLPPVYLAPYRAWTERIRPDGIEFEDEDDMIVVGS
jgi:hypothetical protein